MITSDGGAPLLAFVADRIELWPGLVRCFRDFRDSTRTRHSLRELLSQRIYGLALGYEDLADHDIIGADPVFAATVGKADAHRPGGTRSLASSATLQRLDMSAEAGPHERYRKIACDEDAMRQLFVDLFLDRDELPSEIIIDLDATDVILHGKQEGRFFHGYYRDFCYLPLFAFCGEDLLLAELRTADRGPARDLPELLAPMIERIRERRPGIPIILRGDSAFSTEPLMSWCEEIGIQYLFGLARNQRLESAMSGELAEALALFEVTGEASRVFRDFSYRTLDSWSRERRVVGKAEHLAKGPNPRFVVTNLTAEEITARDLYEVVYCARGEAENRIKEQQLYLYGDRLSAHAIRANQLRLWFSALAYTLFVATRRLALSATPWAAARADSIRLRLLKIGARVKVSARRVILHVSENYPWKDQLTKAWRALAGDRMLC